jgi:galactose mutarotase-like enzyme
MPTLTRLSNEQIAVEVSSLGAEMQALTTSDGRSWLWNGDPKFWTGRSPILFPIVGKTPGDVVSIGGQSYAMGQHGFARRSEFVMVASTAIMCRHSLVSSAATKSVYPFDFELAVEHAIEGNALTVTAQVTNQDQKVMPFGLGFHPAFVWPLPGDDGRSHTVALDNHAEPKLVRLEGGLIAQKELPSPFHGGRLELKHELFVDDAMLFPMGAGEGLTYGAEGGSSLKFGFENLPNLALWSKPGAPFICVEPWHGMAAEVGAPNDLEKRPYTQTLVPGASATFAFQVEILAQHP